LNHRSVNVAGGWPRGVSVVTVPVHFKFTFRGDFLETPEHWSFGFHMKRDNPADDDAHVGDIDEGAVTTALDTFFSSGVGQIPNNAKCTDWRAYEIGPDGLMENNPLVQDVSADDIKGSGGMAYPPQVALAVTTVAVNRGPARFGRFYLPTRAPIGSDSRMSASDANNLAEAVSTFVKSVSNAIDLELTTSSEGLNISQLQGGKKQTWDHLEVGRCLDTLRNRRKSMIEDRESTGHIDW